MNQQLDCILIAYDSSTNYVSKEDNCDTIEVKQLVESYSKLLKDELGCYECGILI